MALDKSLTEKMPHPFNKRRDIIMGIIAAVGVVAPVLYTYRNVYNPAPTLFPVVVYSDDGYGEPLADARVSLNVPEVAAESTDGEGQATFHLNKESLGEEPMLTVSKGGFENYNQRILLASRSDSYRVYLKKKKPDQQGDKSFERSDNKPSAPASEENKAGPQKAENATPPATPAPDLVISARLPSSTEFVGGRMRTVEQSGIQFIVRPHACDIGSRMVSCVLTAVSPRYDRTLVLNWVATTITDNDGDTFQSEMNLARLALDRDQPVVFKLKFPINKDLVLPATVRINGGIVGIGDIQGASFQLR